MGEINSPLGKTNIQGSEPRHFTVPDESGGTPSVQSFASSGSVVPEGYNIPPAQSAQGVFPDVSDPHAHQHQYPPQHPSQPQQREVTWEEAQRLRQQFTNTKLGINPENDRKRVEMLVGIGRDYIEVPIQTPSGKVTYTLSTLKSRERQHVAKAKDILFNLKTQSALIDVRTVTLAYAISSVDGIPLDLILNSNGIPPDDRFIIREAFIQELDDNLATYLFENFEKLDEDNRNKFSIKTPEDAKEVAEALSKSGQGS